MPARWTPSVALVVAFFFSFFISFLFLLRSAIIDHALGPRSCLHLSIDTRYSGLHIFVAVVGCCSSAPRFLSIFFYEWSILAWFRFLSSFSSTVRPPVRPPVRMTSFSALCRFQTCFLLVRGPKWEWPFGFVASFVTIEPEAHVFIRADCRHCYSCGSWIESINEPHVLSLSFSLSWCVVFAHHLRSAIISSWWSWWW